MIHLLILLAGLIIIALIITIFCYCRSDPISATRSKLQAMARTHARLRAKTPLDDQTLTSALANISNQISSYVGYDPTGGSSPYNSAAFVQYVNDASQLLQQAQSSGSINTQLAQYISKLLSQVTEVTPLEKSSFDSQNMGIIAGQLYMSVMALINGVSWNGQSDDIMQDVQHAVDTYQSWLGGSLTSAAAATYMNDPVVYNLQLDSGNYPPSVSMTVPTGAAKVDAWYWSNGDANKARVWYDLGQFIGFGCIYTADGNTCL